MSLKSWIAEKALTGKLPDWMYRFAGREISMKLNLKEGQVDTKKWWQSKTVLSGIVAVLVAVYNSVGTSLAPTLGWHLPIVPDWIFTILGAMGIYGRVSADTKIG